MDIFNLKELFYHKAIRWFQKNNYQDLFIKKVVALPFAVFILLVIASPFAYSGSPNSAPATIYETPINVDIKNGTMVFRDTNNRSFLFKGSNVVKLEQTWNLKIFIPLFVAILASLSSIALSIVNYRQMKRGKWHEIWVTTVLNRLDELYDDMSLLINEEKGVRYEKAILQRSRAHLVSLLGFKLEKNKLNELFEEIEHGLGRKTENNGIYDALSRISEIVLLEMQK